MMEENDKIRSENYSSNATKELEDDIRLLLLVNAYINVKEWCLILFGNKYLS